jgi:hypothetical protein
MADLPPVASDATINTIWDAFPRGRVVGNASIVPHQQVDFIGRLVDDAGVVHLIEKWQREDREKTAPGGAKRIVSTRTILILFLLLTVEHSAQLVEEVAVLVDQRLTPESLAYLGLDGKAQFSKGRRRTAKLWYFPLYRALERTLAPIDNRPKAPAMVDGKGNRRRGKFPTLAELEAIRESWTAEYLEERLERLQLVCHELIEATNRLEPKEVSDEWKGDLCVDASVVPAFGKRAAPYGGTHGPIDPSAGWYRRDARWQLTTDHQKAKKAVFGFDLTLLIRTNHDPGTPMRHSSLIAGMAVNVPATGLIPAAVKAAKHVRRNGHPVGRLTGDRGYAAGAKAKDYQLEVRKLGYEIVTDYLDSQLGNDSDGDYAGAIQVEGAWYCPAMPQALVEATQKVRQGSITNGEWGSLIDKRKQYMLRPKEKPDERGRVPMMCPARGSGATVNCPIVEAQTGVHGNKDTTVTNPPDENHQDSICRNHHSVSFPMIAGAKLAQGPQFGSREWQTVYSSDRNTIEGGNAYMKDDSKEQLEAAGRRRIRGIAAQTLLIGFLVVASNLRKLQRARDEWMDAGSDAERERRHAKKNEYRRNRKQRDDRTAPWDNFKLKNADAEVNTASPGSEPDPPDEAVDLVHASDD